MEKLHPGLTIRFFTSEKCFGPGVAALLEGIRETHSLRAAAAEMGMAYSKAWTIMKNAEKELGFPLTETAYLELLKVCGFSRAEVFWRTCSDIGIIAFK